MWVRLTVSASLLAFLVGATPTHGQGAAPAGIERAAKTRASYGLSAGRAQVRELMTSADSVASAQYGFPLTRGEHADLLARTAYARAFGAKTLPFVQRLDGYGGTWLDHRDRGRVVVGLKRAGARVKQQVRARLPKVNRGVRFVQVDDTAAELGRALDRADRDWAALRSGIRPQAFAISYRHNRLVVKVLPRQLSRAKRLAGRMARRAGVDVVIERSARVTDSSCPTRYKCWGPLRLGARINYPTVYRARDPLSQWNCAIGFMLSDKTILTAGHCTHRHRGPWHGHAAYRQRFGPIGNRVSTRYVSERRDLARIRLEDWSRNRSTRIFGDAWPTVLTQPGAVVDNMDVCVSLARQNRLWCGRVTEPAARWRSSTAGIWVWGAGMRFNVPGRTSLPGDSGSPVLAKSQACPTCTPVRTPIGIVNAGNEADDGRSPSGQRIDADLYFATVEWALDDRDGWPWLDIYTGKRTAPNPTPTPEPTPEPTEPAPTDPP